jgi:hypothetical protein
MDFLPFIESQSSLFVHSSAISFKDHVIATQIQTTEEPNCALGT